MLPDTRPHSVRHSRYLLTQVALPAPLLMAARLYLAGLFPASARWLAMKSRARTGDQVGGLVDSVDAPHDDVKMMRFMEKKELQPQRNRRLAEQGM